MFEITGDDIASLGDADLRTLIGLLCEAGMRSRGLPTSSVTYGGNQDATDGGLDVRVDLSVQSRIEGFVPKPITGFQIKKPDMPRAEILKEMKPKGVLRPVIIELAAAKGAYIIVSSKGATSDAALSSRRTAMMEAIKGTVAEGTLTLDFYDRSRVATWVRDHPGLIPWVRARIGKSIPGWQAYGAWSLTPSGSDVSYLADDQARIRMGREDEGEGFSAIEGINRIRQLLAKPGHAIRLVGLSGVGKTRLAEALFEANVGEGALDPSLAIYTDEADGPNPPPAVLASDLIARQTSAILVVDNCTPELHRRLSEVVRSRGSTISVITVEYDIREDQPEGTEVFVLETSSVPLIEKLVARRYPHLSQTDSQTIAEFSGGNARVALALASRIEKTETITGLSDEELFKRLFQQRHDHDASLILVAQACSLLYSFDGENIGDDDAELSILGSLIGKSAENMHAGVADLRRRDLVQARAKWRAVLPHAIANRLAKRALESIAPVRVKVALVERASERVLRSFSRRLGQLDECKESQAIVKAWLAPGGLLGNLEDLDELGRAMFSNIAPVAPEAVLLALEDRLSKADEATLTRGTHFVRPLRSIAYDPAYFERAVTLLVKFATLPSGDHNVNEAVGIVESLFYIALSGTHAPVEMRAKIVRSLLASDDELRWQLGAKALRAMMKTGYFSSSYDFRFGARSRDYGYYPPNNDAVRAWFGIVIEIARDFGLSESQAAPVVRKALSQQFRGLWTGSGCARELDEIVRAIATKSFWREGWIAVRETISYDRNGIASELLENLVELESFLRPKDLVSKVRGLVVGAGRGLFDPDDVDDDDIDEGEEGTSTVASYEARQARLAESVREIGHDVAADETAFQTVLPELMNWSARTAIFGSALSEAADNPRAMWDRIVDTFAATKDANVHLLCGFIGQLHKRDAMIANSILDESIDHPVLASQFPYLQLASPIDSRALCRLHQALGLGHAKIDSYFGIACRPVRDSITASDFCKLVIVIMNKPDGLRLSIQIISTCIMLYESEGIYSEPETLEVARLVLAAFEFRPTDGRAFRDDHDLGVIVRASLAGSEGAPIAKELCRKLKLAAKDHRIDVYDYDDLMKGLLRTHPVVILDTLFSDNHQEQIDGVRILNDFDRFHKDIMGEIPDDVLMMWCDREPLVRYPIAASIVRLFTRPKEGEAYAWTPLTEQLLQRAPEPVAVMNEIIYRLQPLSWSGSLATKLEEHFDLLKVVPGRDRPELCGLVANAKAQLRARIERERIREAKEDYERNNRFEE